jgi:hypothetical protein
VYLIMFKTRHALLLPGGRFLSPRNGRDEGAEQPRNEMDSWPQTRRFREREQARHRTRAKTVHVHEQSATALNPRQRTGQQTVRIRVLASASTVRKQASAQSTRYPQVVRSLELSVPMNSPQTGIALAFHQAANCPRRRIVVVIAPQVSFHIHVQIIPVYVHI